MIDPRASAPNLLRWLMLQTQQVLPTFLRVLTAVLEGSQRLIDKAGTPATAGGHDLITYVFGHCLFGPKGDVNATCAPSLPKCKTEAARNAAMRLLTVLVQKSDEQTSRLCQLLLPHHTSVGSKPRKGRANKWELSNQVTARSSTGYVEWSPR